MRLTVKELRSILLEAIRNANQVPPGTKLVVKRSLFPLEFPEIIGSEKLPILNPELPWVQKGKVKSVIKKDSIVVLTDKKVNVRKYSGSIPEECPVISFNNHEYILLNPWSVEAVEDLDKAKSFKFNISVFDSLVNAGFKLASTEKQIQNGTYIFSVPGLGKDVGIYVDKTLTQDDPKFVKYIRVSSDNDFTGRQMVNRVKDLSLSDAIDWCFKYFKKQLQHYSFENYAPLVKDFLQKHPKGDAIACVAWLFGEQPQEEEIRQKISELTGYDRIETPDDAFDANKMLGRSELKHWQNPLIQVSAALNNLRSV